MILFNAKNQSIPLQDRHRNGFFTKEPTMLAGNPPPFGQGGRNSRPFQVHVEEDFGGWRIVSYRRTVLLSSLPELSIIDRSIDRSMLI
jgi:hypothetical protein